MAIVGNIVSEAGDILYIKTDVPAIGILALTGFIEDIDGETVDTYFDRQFRYSIDGGIAFSSWIPLTLANVQAIAIQPSDILFLEYRYKRVGLNVGTLEFNSNEVIGNYDPASLTCGYYFNNSIFKKYLDCNDVEVLGWYINVTEKLFKTTNVAKYVGRINELGSTEDFLILWRWISKFFAYFVIFSRKFETFYQNQALLSEYLMQRGLKISEGNALFELIQLMSEYKHQIAIRGTYHIYDKKVADRDWQENADVDGELLRFINYVSTDEFIFTQHLPENLGWKMNRSSPMYRGLPFEINANKIYEPNGIQNISRWPTNGTRVGNTIRLDSGQEISDNQALKYIKVDHRLDYEFSFEANGIGAISVGMKGFNLEGTQLNFQNMKDGTVSNEFLSLTVLPQNKYYRIKCIIYNTNKPLFANDKLNIQAGNNLRFVEDIVKVIPQINCSGGSVSLRNFTLRPLLTPYSRGFLQTKNFTTAWVKNKSGIALKDVESWVDKYLINYNETIKLINIGDWTYTGEGTDNPPPVIQYAWTPVGFACDYSDSVYTDIGGLKVVTTLGQYNVATGVLTGETKPNEIGDPDYVASVKSATCPLLTHYEFVFVDVNGATRSATYVANTLNVSGINVAIPISIVGGEYRINAGAWVSSAGLVGNGDAVQVRLVSSPNFNTLKSAVLSINGYSDSYDVRTLLDNEPDEYSFTTINGLPLSTLTPSEIRTITGLQIATNISIVGNGGQYRINGGAWTSAAGTINNNDTVQVRLTTSNAYSTSLATTLTIGTMSRSFTVRTMDNPNTTIYIHNNTDVQLGVTTSGGAHYSSTINGDLTFELPIGQTYILYNAVNPSDFLYVNAKVQGNAGGDELIYGLEAVEFATIQGMSLSAGLAYAAALSKHIANITVTTDITVYGPDTYFINARLDSEPATKLVLASQDGDLLPVYSFTPIDLPLNSVDVLKTFSIYQNLAKFGFAVTVGTDVYEIAFKGITYNVANQIALGNFTKGVGVINGINMDWYQTEIQYGTDTPYDFSIYSSPIPVPILYSHTKDEDPVVDTVMVPLVNGVNIGNIFATSTGNFGTRMSGSTFLLSFEHNINQIPWPVGSSARVVITNNGTTMFDSGNVTNPSVQVLATHSFLLKKGDNWLITSTSTSTSTAYSSVSLDLDNQSSAPLSGGSVVVDFEIKDNTDGLFVLKTGQYTQPQNNIGFNYLNDASTGKLTITNNHTGALKFTVTNVPIGGSFTQDITVAAGASGIMDLLPKTGIKITYVDSGAPAPVCPDRVMVFQICNENSAIDDNFDVYLNDVMIGSVYLYSASQIGSVFIGSLGTPDIVSSDFACPLGGMVNYYFDPALIVGGTNTIKMINTQENGNNNQGTVGVRNYLISGDELSAPCVVDDLVFSGVTGANFELTFNYTACCPEDE